MNAKQSLKQAAQYYKEQAKEIAGVLRLARRDIVQYNACIDAMIAGGSPCPWCEDYLECDTRKTPEGQRGCKEWLLAFDVSKNLEVISDDTEDTVEDTTGGAAGGTSGGGSGAGTGSAEVPEGNDADQPHSDKPRRGRKKSGGGNG